ncbi:MAG: TonB-dependent receptor [Woeseiaceae bacterium]
MRILESRRTALILAVIGLSAVSTGTAQEQSARILEEITVTAAYREQGLQNVPVSISAVTGETLIESAVQKAEDIQFLVPNFTLTETGIGTNAFIRGIGSGINQAFEQSVGTYVDGVHYGRAQQWRAPFLDLERVEVLRGPQSILFGKNSVAGAVNITTAKPTDEFEGSILVSQEFEFNESIVEGVLSGAITDRFRARVAARVRDGDGHMVNATLGQDEPQREDFTVRGTIQFDVTDNFMATLKAEVGEFDVTGRHIEIINEQPSLNPAFAGLLYNQILQAFGGDPSTGNVVKDGIRSSNGDFSNNELNNLVLTLDWAIGEHDLKSITAYSEFDYDEFCDCDFTGTDVFGAALQETYEQFSQEFRLSSPVGGGFDYILGLYYQTSDHDFADQIIFSADSVLVPIGNLLSPGAGDLVANTQADRVATVDSDVISAFAQFNFHFSDQLTMQLGGRVTKDERDGFRTLAINSVGGDPLPVAQTASPFVWAQLLDITSTNLIALGQSAIPQLSVPANAFTTYGWMDPGAFTMPCTAASDPTLCSGELGALPVDGSRDETKFSPEVKLVWDASDNTMVYVSWSEGFKSGSYDFRANNKGLAPDMASSFEFDDEEASNIEAGGKFIMAGGAFELNAAVFFTEFDDLQISIFDGGLGFNVGNAASAEVFGVELDMRWAATDYLTISGGLAFTDFEFTDFENGQCYFGRPPDSIENGIPRCDYTGESNQMVSDTQGNLTFDYQRPFGNSLQFSGALDLFYTSEYDASATYDPALVQDAYSTVNLRLGIGSQTGSWQVALLGRNLTDEKVLSFGGDTPLSGSIFLAKSNYAFYTPGSTYSAQLMLRF